MGFSAPGNYIKIAGGELNGKDYKMEAGLIKECRGLKNYQYH